MLAIVTVRLILCNVPGNPEDAESAFHILKNFDQYIDLLNRVGFSVY